ncbi:MAG: hypothetical protein SOZ48_00155 [Eubacterium sp.]|nr:hypothetical protein [Eubacterium sp.]
MMKKKILFLCCAAILTLGIVACGKTEEGMSREEAENVLSNCFGDKDEYGNKYSFGYEDTVTVDGVEYHVFDWRTFVDDNSCHNEDLFVATDGSGLRTGVYKGEDSYVCSECSKSYLESLESACSYANMVTSGKKIDTEDYHFKGLQIP